MCSTGYARITIKSLGYFFESNLKDPKFPILYDDFFIMEGYFKSTTSQDKLENILGMQSIEIVFWQNNRQLAYYYDTLDKILCHQSVQILLTPSQHFPVSVTRNFN